MLKLLIPAAICIPMIVLGSTYSSANTVEIENAPNFDVIVEEKIEHLEKCETTEIPVYFHDDHITQHSAELLNDAAVASHGCNVTQVKLTIFDTTGEQDELKRMSQSMKDYILSAQVSGSISVDVKTIIPDTQSLNGRVGTVKFTLVQ